MATLVTNVLSISHGFDMLHNGILRYLQEGHPRIDKALGTRMARRVLPASYELM